MELKILKMLPSICLLICAINAGQVSAIGNKRLELYDENYYTYENECTKPTTCVPMTNGTCFGTQLPHSMTTLDLIPHYEKTPYMISKRFHQLQVAQYVPKCWEAVQPLLCALYKPKCMNGYYRKPGFRMCMKAFIACKPIRDHPIWPEFLDCGNKTMFPESCKDPTIHIEFDKTSKCIAPLISSESQEVFGIGGCGLPCRDSFFSSEEHETTDMLVCFGACTCVCFNLFAIITLIATNPKKPFTNNVLALNMYFIVFCLGLLLQFTPLTSPEEIACHKDGTRRIEESFISNFWASLVFVLIYSSMMGVMVQWISFSESWYRTVFPKTKKFNFERFSILFMILMGIIIFLGKIDGSGISGVAFKGLNNLYYILFSVVIFLFITVFWSERYFSKASNQLIYLSLKYKEPKLRWINLKVTLFGVVLSIPVLFILTCYVIELWNELPRKEAYENYIKCKIFNTVGENNECSIQIPNLILKQSQILAVFFMGIVISSLVWTKSAFQSWIDFYGSICGKRSNKEYTHILLIDFDGLSEVLGRIELEKTSNDQKKQEKAEKK